MYTITKHIVPEEARIDFLPRHFGGMTAMLVEATIYAQLSQLCSRYKGGIWNFYTLSNGGCFIAPTSEQPLPLENATNGSNEVMSAEAAGIVACLYAFSHLSFRPGMQCVRENFHNLREYAVEHPESEAILALID